ncbi:MAG: hypothetical protein QF464_22975, partial [Myxococcota bacterium]|nr:hypothetical protein [Myxococcota bacterium]
MSARTSANEVVEPTLRLQVGPVALEVRHAATWVGDFIDEVSRSFSPAPEGNPATVSAVVEFGEVDSDDKHAPNLHAVPVLAYDSDHGRYLYDDPDLALRLEVGEAGVQFA